jgi:hypothetical protein
MRRSRQDHHPASMFHGAELRRLVIGVLMLIVLGMLIVQSGRPSNWQWLSNATAPPPSKPAAPPPPLPEASGPTDEDPDQAGMAREEFQVFNDGTENLNRAEMSPYDRVVFWVNNQSFERLYRRAKKGLRYTHLYDDAEKRRGELVALDLLVCRAEDIGKNRDSMPLHEVWATTNESYGRMYSLIVVGYPKGMPLGTFTPPEKAKFAGYFLKLQGYSPADAKPGARPEKAPLLIGRLEWEPSAAPERNSAQEWFWGLTILAVIGVAWATGWIYLKMRGKEEKIRPGMTYAPTGEVIPIDDWLEQSDFSSPKNDTRPEEQDER